MATRHIGSVYLWAVAEGYPDDWATAIVCRCQEDTFPPYEYWRALAHPQELEMVMMVARGIARWIEMQHEYTQDFVLDMLGAVDLTGDGNDGFMDFNTICMSIWAQMSAYDWLKRHCFHPDHKSHLWRMAIVRVCVHMQNNSWNKLRNYHYGQGVIS